MNSNSLELFNLSRYKSQVTLAKFLHVSCLVFINVTRPLVKKLHSSLFFIRFTHNDRMSLSSSYLSITICFFCYAASSNSFLIAQITISSSLSHKSSLPILFLYSPWMRLVAIKFAFVSLAKSPESKRCLTRGSSFVTKSSLRCVDSWSADIILSEKLQATAISPIVS